MNIPEKAKKINTWARGEGYETILIIIVIIVSNLISFKIGQNNPQNLTQNQGLNLRQEDKTDYSLKDADLPEGSLAAAIYNSQNLDPKREESTPQKAESELGVSIPPRYVASKNGRVYYFTWCAGAKRIPEENRNYFQTAKDARAAGLTPSTACPDLD